MTSTVPLTISRNYVSTWGIWEAIREIIQNAIDTKQYQVEYGEGTITVSTTGGVIDRRHLLLGETSKRNDEDSIGTYGEGFKLALLVLLRENREVSIKNGTDLWTPIFQNHEQLNEECLAIKIEENVFISNNDKVSFHISGLTSDEISEIQSKTLYNFNKALIEAEYKSSFCWYSKGEPKLYVGGLFVCDLDKKYQMSYNFAPNVLELDRDRKSVHTFYLSLEATRLMICSDNIDLVAELAHEGAEDVSDYYNVEYYGGSSAGPATELKKVVSEHFTKNHGLNAYPINAGADEKVKRVQTLKAIDAGLTPVVVRTGHYNLLNDELKEQKVSSYKSFNLSEELFNFYEKHKNQLRGKPRRDLQEILRMAELYDGKRELPVVVKEKVAADEAFLNDDIPF